MRPRTTVTGFDPRSSSTAPGSFIPCNCHASTAPQSSQYRLMEERAVLWLVQGLSGMDCRPVISSLSFVPSSSNNRIVRCPSRRFVEININFASLSKQTFSSALVKGLSAFGNPSATTLSATKNNMYQSCIPHSLNF